MHTVQGRKLGRGELYWLKVSSETTNRSAKYLKWRSWWQPLMIEITKAKEAEKK